MITNRPKIICHMVTSIDGKVTGSFLDSQEASQGIEQYYDIHHKFSTSFACGRETMEKHFTHGYYPDLSQFKDLKDYDGDFITIVGHKCVIAFDRYGKLGWTSDILYDIDARYNGFYIIEVVTKKAPKEYLAYLRSINLPYIICGDDELDLELALLKLYHCFNIKSFLLEGGSVINGIFHNMDYIDQLSIVTVPLIADINSKPLITNSTLKEFQILSSIQTTDAINSQFVNYNHDVYNAKIGPSDINECLREIRFLKEFYDNVFEYDEKELYKLKLAGDIKINFDNVDFNFKEYGCLYLNNEIIHPYMLKFIPKILDMKEKTIKNIMAGKTVVVFNEDNNNFRLIDYRDTKNFDEENYYILSNLEYVSSIIDSINLEEALLETNDEESRKIYQAFIDNNLKLNDIFTSKILIDSFTKNHLNKKKKSNSILYKTFVDVLVKEARLNDVKNNKAPRLIKNHENKRLQTAVNNYYDLCFKFINK